MASLVLSVFFGLLATFIASKWIAYRKALARINHHPGPRLFVAPYSFLGFLVPRIPYISGGPSYFQFEQAGSSAIGFASFLPATSRFCVADTEAVKQIANPKSAFKKLARDYRALTRFGGNLVGAEGADWRRQRRICAPAFSEKNNKLVWSTALGFTNDMIATWENGSVVRVHDVCEDVTLPIALCVIAKAGYGQDVKWKDEEVPPAGHELTFKQALLTVSEKIYLPLLLPNWAWGLRESWRYVRKANNELRLYIQEMVVERRELQDMAARSLIEKKHDIFNQIIQAHDNNEMLSEDELIGNAFVFLVAGHETTANSLAIALSLLALYPEEQAKLAREIRAAQPEGREFTYDDMPKLPYALAVLYETLRLYPMAPVIPKYAATNTSLTVNTSVSHTPATIAIPESAKVSIMARGLHYNPQYWDDPFDFYPARFMSPDWNRDAFIPFSVGQRSCIGRRFAETTVVAALAGLLSKYSVSVDETRFKTILHESAVDRRERFFKFSYKITPAPQKVALVFTPRT
ncbi:hypothetical protein FRC12_013321 [Ceratobasidium sp. 428]|nr:hypothetical protein FRC12_013321 [Ceratobasidium sp. 428]